MSKKLSEGEICELFRHCAEQQGWTVYPEVSSWDLVLVWEHDDRCMDPPHWKGRDPVFMIRRGDQVAVEAKARSKLDAFAQAIDRRPSGSRGPDFIALLAPSWTSSHKTIAHELGFLLFDSSHYVPVEASRRRLGGSSSLVKDIRYFDKNRLVYGDKMWVPPVVSSMGAGVPSPSALTPWRVKALKMCGLLRSRGHVTSGDFKLIGLSFARWRMGHPGQKWLEDSGEKIGRSTKWVLPEELPLDFPDLGWESERDEIMAVEAAKEEGRTT
jgi:hypothetical protein